ncbi:hypothetical protein DM50_3748 [Burkholderia mallei]|nr:hypothetical protein DM50_3748 [Burkholderia mallei]
MPAHTWIRPHARAANLERVGPHAHDHLAEVLPAEQADQRPRRRVEPVDDVLARLHLALRDPFAHILQEGRINVRVVIEDDEALHPDPLAQHARREQRQAVRAARQLAVVVVSDQPAHRHARMIVQQRQHRVEHRAADVLEIHVDAVRARGGELFREIGIVVIDARVEAERPGHIAALVRAARDADDAATLELRDLPDDRAHRAARRRDGHRLARLRLADVQQSEVRGEARHAEHAERVRRMRDVRERHQVGAVGHGVVLPAGVRQHEIAVAERGHARRDDAAHRSAHHHAAELDGRSIRGRVAHAAAHVRIERQPDRAQQHLARRGHGHRRRFGAEILRRGRALRARVQHDPAVGRLGLRHGFLRRNGRRRQGAANGAKRGALTGWPRARGGSRRA